MARQLLIYHLSAGVGMISSCAEAGIFKMPTWWACGVLER